MKQFRAKHLPILNRVFNRLFGLVVILFGSFFAQTAVAQTETFPLELFWDRLEIAQQVIHDEPSPAELAALADQFDRLSTYILPDGRITAIRPQSLIFALRQENPDLEVISDQIDALLATRESWEQGDYTQAELDQLAQILADPEFDYAEPSPNIVQEFLQDIWLRTSAFFRGLIPEQLRGSNTLATILSVVGVVGFVLMLGAALYSLYRSFYAEASGIDSFDEEAAYLTADAALSRAQEFSSGGDYRTAVRYLYLSALLLLEEQGLIRYDRSLTNREYLRSVAHKPELVTILKNVIEVFDRVWYGFQPLAAAEYNEYAQQVDLLKQLRVKK